MANPERQRAAFPTTLWSDILSLGEGDPLRQPEKLGRLIERYWKPAYWVIRSQGAKTEEDARDLAQDFFVKLMDGRTLSTADPKQGTFRTYLRGALKFFLLQTHTKDHRLKRNAGNPLLSLDFATAGREPADLGSEPGAALDRAWGHALLAEGLAALEKGLSDEGKSRDFQVFHAYEISAPTPKPSYEEIASRFGIGKDDVWNILRMNRRRLRSFLMDRIRDYARDENDVFDELRELFGR